jgi:hypothetical protein
VILALIYLNINQNGRYVFIPDPIKKRPFGSEYLEKVFDTQTGTLYKSSGSKWEVIRIISDEKMDIKSQSEITDTARINQDYIEPDSISN